MAEAKILVVDDEVKLKTALVETLIEHGYEAAGYTSGHEALAALREQAFDVLISDLMMPEMGGIALLQAGLDIDPDLVGIIMTGQGTIQTAVEAMKLGAFDYVLKPFKLQTFLPILTRAIQVRHLRLENQRLHALVEPFEHCRQLPRFHVPHSAGSLPRGCGQPPVRREGQGRDRRRRPAPVGGRPFQVQERLA